MIVYNIFGIISIMCLLLAISLYFFRWVYMYILKNKNQDKSWTKIQKNINNILPFLTKYHNLFWMLCLLSSCVYIYLN